MAVVDPDIGRFPLTVIELDGENLDDADLEPVRGRLPEIRDRGIPMPPAASTRPS
ncbi:hypothetical protein AB3662_33335 [Sorangium cellulosum]|uniref:hypothetical protein n=1 Tax=Sorangium cellulosum TaxID=56 RepID=UPI003D9A366F